MYDVIEKYLKICDYTFYASDGMHVNTQLEPSIVNEAEAMLSMRFFSIFLCELIISISKKSAIYGM